MSPKKAVFRACDVERIMQFRLAGNVRAGFGVWRNGAMTKM